MYAYFAEMICRPTEVPPGAIALLPLSVPCVLESNSGGIFRAKLLQKLLFDSDKYHRLDKMISSNEQTQSLVYL